MKPLTFALGFRFVSVLAALASFCLATHPVQANPSLEKALSEPSTPIVIRMGPTEPDKIESVEIGRVKRDFEDARRFLAESSEHFGRKDPVFILAGPKTEIGWVIKMINLASQSHDTVIPLVYGATHNDPIAQISGLAEGESARELIFGPNPVIFEPKPSSFGPIPAQAHDTILYPPPADALQRMLGK